MGINEEAYKLAQNAIEQQARQPKSAAAAELAIAAAQKAQAEAEAHEAYATAVLHRWAQGLGVRPQDIDITGKKHIPAKEGSPRGPYKNEIPKMSPAQTCLDFRMAEYPYRCWVPVTPPKGEDHIRVCMVMSNGSLRAATTQLEIGLALVAAGYQPPQP